MRPRIRLLLEKVKEEIINVISGGSFFFLLKIMHCVLEGENVKPNSSGHLERVFREIYQRVLKIVLFLKIPE